MNELPVLAAPGSALRLVLPGSTSSRRDSGPWPPGRSDQPAPQATTAHIILHRNGLHGRLLSRRNRAGAHHDGLASDISSFRRPGPARNTKSRCDPRIPHIRHLRKTRIIPAFSRFAVVRKSREPDRTRQARCRRVGLPPPRRFRGPTSQPRADEARMRTNARRGSHALTMVVLTAAVSLSGRVEAQQTGLFPLAPIRRQRVPCDREDPTYKIYKQQYFGYHPTCWRTFPRRLGMPEQRGARTARSRSRNSSRATNPRAREPSRCPVRIGRPPLQRRAGCPGASAGARSFPR